MGIIWFLLLTTYLLQPALSTPPYKSIEDELERELEMYKLKKIFDDDNSPDTEMVDKSAAAENSDNFQILQNLIQSYRDAEDQRKPYYSEEPKAYGNPPRYDYQVSPQVLAYIDYLLGRRGIVRNHLE